MKKGFTLIELLVVISIIGILVSVAIASYSGAQIKARDARRRSDMTAIQATMEQYYATDGNSTYAAVATAYGTTSPVPKDPKASSSYNVTYVSTTGYCICATLEEVGKGNANVPTSESCNWNGTTGNYFCIQNQQ